MTDTIPEEDSPTRSKGTYPLDLGESGTIPESGTVPEPEATDDLPRDGVGLDREVPIPCLSSSNPPTQNNLDHTQNNKDTPPNILPSNTIPVRVFMDSIHEHQKELFRVIDRKQARFIMMNWHRRARKTTFGLNLLIREAFKNPNQVYGYIAPTYTQAKAIIWRDPNMLHKYLPDDIVKRKNESELYVELINGSMIAIKGADNPDNIRGTDYAGVFVDEWALQKTMVWEEILRPIITQDKDRWAVFAFTPKGRNFVYDYWIKAEGWSEWYKSYLPVQDSGLVNEGELEKARMEMPEQLYLQEFECSFLADEENTLISAKSIEDLKHITRHDKAVRRVISCDPSQGGDECIIDAFENSRIIDQKIINVKDTMLIVGEIAAMMKKHDIKRAAVDGIGIGAGIVDRLREQGKDVYSIISSESAYDKDRFYNLRAEMWWYVMDQIKQGMIDYPDDPELRRELSFVKAFVVDSNGKIKLEAKKQTKERLGRSPDRADAFVYGIWALKDIAPWHPKDSWGFEQVKNVYTTVKTAMTS